MSNRELLNCPFCGVEAYIKYEDMDGLYTSPVDFHGENEPWAIIYAEHKDGCWLNEADVFDWFETAYEAIETWNTRAERICKWHSRGELGGYEGECGAMMINRPNYCPKCGARVISEVE